MVKGNDELVGGGGRGLRIFISVLDFIKDQKF